MKYYPYEPNKTKITVGVLPFYQADAVNNTVENCYKKAKEYNHKGELKTKWLECMKNNATVDINNDLNEQEIALYKTGSLYESPDGKSAVAIINGVVAISNSKRNGEWYWSTVSDGGKMIVNNVYTGTLFTEFVKLMGEGAKLEINNNMITFMDINTEETERIRAKLGVTTKDGIVEPYSVTKLYHMQENNYDIIKIFLKFVIKLLTFKQRSGTI